jgi:hypothetical protein
MIEVEEGVECGCCRDYGRILRRGRILLEQWVVVIV